MPRLKSKGTLSGPMSGGLSNIALVISLVATFQLPAESIATAFPHGLKLLLSWRIAVSILRTHPTENLLSSLLNRVEALIESQYFSV